MTILPQLLQLAHSGLSLADPLSPQWIWGPVRVRPEALSLPAMLQHHPAQSRAQKRYQWKSVYCIDTQMSFKVAIIILCYRWGYWVPGNLGDLPKSYKYWKNKQGTETRQLESIACVLIQYAKCLVGWKPAFQKVESIFSTGDKCPSNITRYSISSSLPLPQFCQSNHLTRE